MAEPLIRSDLPLPLLRRGKVREVYTLGEDRLLMVASDRVSAFDVVMDEPIPRKGEVLTQITAWWLSQLGREGVEHHLLAVDPDRIVALHPELAGCRDRWARRAMLVRRTEPVPVECVVRGYLSGSAWNEYRQRGTLAGEALPSGLVESERLPTPLFSPATKAAAGHDENITFDDMAERVGTDLATRLRERSLAIYEHGRAVCAARGILLADSKFEFGHAPDGTLLLIDEVLTPDSSRFWLAASYTPGRSQPSLDKQPIRDWLDALPDWDRSPPPPTLPAEVVQAATERYLLAFRQLTGESLDGWRAPPFAMAGP
jgi:phosphoribosylaminoimidazole-succinocarboxamide synthase